MRQHFSRVKDKVSLSRSSGETLVVQSTKQTNETNETNETNNPHPPHNNHFPTPHPGGKNKKKQINPHSPETKKQAGRKLKKLHSVVERKEFLFFRIIVVQFTVFHIEIPAVNFQTPGFHAFANPGEGHQILH